MERDVQVRRVTERWTLLERYRAYGTARDQRVEFVYADPEVEENEVRLTMSGIAWNELDRPDEITVRIKPGNRIEQW